MFILKYFLISQTIKHDFITLSSSRACWNETRPTVKEVLQKLGVDTTRGMRSEHEVLLIALEAANIVCVLLRLT